MRILLFFLLSCQSNTDLRQYPLVISKYTLTTPQGTIPLLSHNKASFIKEEYAGKKVYLNLNLKIMKEKSCFFPNRRLLIDDFELSITKETPNKQIYQLPYQGFFFSELKFAYDELIKKKKIALIFEDKSLFESMKEDFKIVSVTTKHEKEWTFIELEIDQNVLLMKFKDKKFLGLYWPSQNYSLEYVD